MKGNNMDNNISYVRDTFLNSEGEYANKIQGKVKNAINELSNVPSESLYRIARELIDEVEYTDSFSWEDMEKIEKELIILLSSIKDVTLTKELVLTPSYEEEELTLSLNRGRRR